MDLELAGKKALVTGGSRGIGKAIAAVLAALKDGKQPFFRFALRQSERHRRWFAERPLAAEALAEHRQRAAQSFAQQARMEAEDRVGFDEFLNNYLALPE